MENATTRRRFLASSVAAGSLLLTTPRAPASVRSANDRVRIAVAAALANPWAWRVLLGPVGTDQLASNLAGAELTLPADAAEELIRKLNARLGHSEAAE